MCSTRLVEESGGITRGACTCTGNFVAATATRSDTICLTLNKSVSRSKSITTEETP